MLHRAAACCSVLQRACTATRYEKGFHLLYKLQSLVGGEAAFTPFMQATRPAACSRAADAAQHVATRRNLLQRGARCRRRRGVCGLRVLTRVLTRALCLAHSAVPPARFRGQLWLCVAAQAYIKQFAYKSLTSWEFRDFFVQARRAPDRCVASSIRECSGVPVVTATPRVLTFIVR